jgi:hypothetical protein
MLSLNSGARFQGNFRFESSIAAPPIGPMGFWSKFQGLSIPKAWIAETFNVHAATIYRLSEVAA